MKSYPSIPRSRGQSFREIRSATIFDKIDGSTIRAEWSSKRGISWSKFGTRDRLVDASDPVFGVTEEIFRRDWEEALSRIASDNGWDRGVCFFELYGPSSFAGRHDEKEAKRLILIDVAPHKKGILGPRDFLDIFGGLDIPSVVDVRNWTRDYVERVWRGEIDGVTFEGVVAKGGEGHRLVMAKAKTEAWVLKVKELFSPEEAERIINS